MNSGQWKALNEKAKTKSLDEFTTDASDISRLTKEEIASVIKESTVDKGKLSELMSIMHDAAKSNHEKAEAIRNTAGLAELTVGLLGKLIG